MKYILVVGSRTFNNYTLMELTLNKVVNGFTDICIVSGGTRGADKLAEEYAKRKGFQCIVMNAEWNKYGKSAGYRRNEEMHKFISEHKQRRVIAFWDGQSKGTQHNFDLAKKYNNPLHIIRAY